MKNIFLIMLVVFPNFLEAQIPDELTKTEKIYGLSKFWQEVNYNFVYLNKIDKEKWDEEYKKMIVDVQKTENDYEYYRLLQKFCALLKDGHTNVYFPKEVQNKILYSDFGEYKIFVSNIDGKAIITRINSKKKEELPIGTEIIKVNGIETMQYIKENVFPYISASTKYILEDRGIERMFQGIAGTSFDIEVKFPDGKTRSLELIHEKSTENELYPPYEKGELIDFKWINGDIAYMALNSFSNKKIDSLFISKLPELFKAKKLIIDLRNNGGGNTGIGRNIFKYLTNDTVLYGLKTQSRLHIPSFKAWGKSVGARDTVNNAWAKQAYLSYRDNFYHNFPYYPHTIELVSDRIVVPTVLLIGHNTASAAEDFLIFADNQKHMFKIGEPTYGSTGQPMMFELSGGSIARICTKKDTYPDGKEFVGYGIQPDIKVKKTLSDYIENKDPALEEAVKYLKQRK